MFRCVISEVYMSVFKQKNFFHPKTIIGYIKRHSEGYNQYKQTQKGSN